MSAPIPNPSSTNPHSIFDPERDSDLDHPRCFTDTHGIITTTMIDVPGFRVVKVLGTVYGLSVRTRNIATGTWTMLKGMAGGELHSFTKLLYSSRDQAVERMVGECMSRGGNAIVAMKFDTSELMQCAQVCAYGTACLVEKVD